MAPPPRPVASRVINTNINTRPMNLTVPVLRHTYLPPERLGPVGCPAVMIPNTEGTYMQHCCICVTTTNLTCKCQVQSVKNGRSNAHAIGLPLFGVPGQGRGINLPVHEGNDSKSQVNFKIFPLLSVKTCFKI